MSDPGTPDVDAVTSVAICTKDRPDDLARAVASILADRTVALQPIAIDQSTDPDDCSEPVQRTRLGAAPL